MRGFTKHKVLFVKNLTTSTFIVRFERNNLSFIPGQYIVVGIEGDFNTREYSIYSSKNDNYLEILVREINEGYLSQRLKKLKKGDNLVVYGPYGEFVIHDGDMKTQEFVMIATGTGISPIHSIIRSYPELNYKLIHGVRYKEESYGLDDYKFANYFLCTSRDENARFKGYVTDFMKKFQYNPNQLFYISGNNLMITDVIGVLKKNGVKVKQYNLEIYF